jgi:hypothetical protein
LYILVQNNRQNYSSVCFHAYVFRQKMGRQKIMHQMVTGIPQFPDSSMLKSSRFFWNISAYRLNYIMSHIIIDHHDNLKSQIWFGSYNLNFISTSPLHKRYNVLYTQYTLSSIITSWHLWKF